VIEVSNFLYDYCVRKKSETLELERTTYLHGKLVIEPLPSNGFIVRYNINSTVLIKKTQPVVCEPQEIYSH
jgi:hypothetical protein